MGNVGVEGMISYEIGYNTGKAIIIYYRASAGWGQKNRLNVFFANSVSSDNQLYERYWKHVYVADTDATGHWEWQCHGTYYNSDDTRVVRYSALNLELEATIGGGNNPVLVVDVQAIDKSSFSTCTIDYFFCFYYLMLLYFVFLFLRVSFCDLILN